MKEDPLEALLKQPVARPDRCSVCKNPNVEKINEDCRRMIKAKLEKRKDQPGHRMSWKEFIKAHLEPRYGYSVQAANPLLNHLREHLGLEVPY